MKDKNEEFIVNNISFKLFEIINKLTSMTVHVIKWFLKFVPDNYIRKLALLE